MTRVNLDGEYFSRNVEKFRLLREYVEKSLQKGVLKEEDLSNIEKIKSIRTRIGLKHHNSWADETLQAFLIKHGGFKGFIREPVYNFSPVIAAVAYLKMLNPRNEYDSIHQTSLGESKQILQILFGHDIPRGDPRITSLRSFCHRNSFVDARKLIETTLHAPVDQKTLDDIKNHLIEFLEKDVQSKSNRDSSQRTKLLTPSISVGLQNTNRTKQSHVLSEQESRSALTPQVQSGNNNFSRVLSVQKTQHDSTQPQSSKNSLQSSDQTLPESVNSAQLEFAPPIQDAQHVRTASQRAKPTLPPDLPIQNAEHVPAQLQSDNPVDGIPLIEHIRNVPRARDPLRQRGIMPHEEFLLLPNRIFLREDFSSPINNILRLKIAEFCMRLNSSRNKKIFLSPKRNISLGGVRETDENVPTKKCRFEENPDRMFLLSLLPYLERIPDSQKLRVRTELQETINNASRRPSNFLTKLNDWLYKK